MLYDLKVIWLTAALALLSARPLTAEIAWTVTALDLAPAPGSATLEARFPFQNRGKAPVTITAIETSCSCTVAETSRKTYAPGERGVVQVIFHLGSDEGTVERDITVTTDEKSRSPTTLALTAHLPRILDLPTTSLRWIRNEAPRARGIRLRPAAGWTVASVRTSSRSFSVGTQPEHDGVTVLTVTPRSTAQVTNSAIVIRLRGPEGRFVLRELDAKVL